MITVQGHGRLTRDPELRDLPDGTRLAALRIAADDSRARTIYLNVAGFGKPSEPTVRHLRKGSEVVFYGELRFREAGTDSGRREYYSAVVHIEFAGRRHSDQPAASVEGASQDPDDTGAFAFAAAHHRPVNILLVRRSRGDSCARTPASRMRYSSDCRDGGVEWAIASSRMSTEPEQIACGRDGRGTEEPCAFRSGGTPDDPRERHSGNPED